MRMLPTTLAATLLLLSTPVLAADAVEAFKQDSLIYRNMESTADMYAKISGMRGGLSRTEHCDFADKLDRAAVEIRRVLTEGKYTGLRGARIPEGDRPAFSYLLADVETKFRAQDRRCR